MSDPGMTGQIGRYEILAKLGAGGMGIVLRARDPKLQREVAVKLMLGTRSADPGLQERFRREARSLAQLSHPNVVRVFDFGTEEEHLYYVMELLEGTGLDERLATKEARKAALPPFRPREFLDTFLPLADALATVHAQGIVHRDIKPPNIRVHVPERGPVLTDFGLVSIADLPRLTAEGKVVGSIRYMAPEQVLGRPVTELADIYSLGLCMYEFATCRQPFDEIPASGLFFARAVAVVAAVEEAAPGRVPPAIAAIIDQSVLPEPSQRIPSAQALREALAEAATGRSSHRRAAAGRLLQPGSLPGTSRLGTGPQPTGPMATPGATPEGPPASMPWALLLGMACLSALLAVVAFFVLRGAPGAADLGSQARGAAVSEPAALSPAAPAPVKALAAARRLTTGKQLTLTEPGEGARRVAMASVDGRVVVLWLRADGRVRLAVGEDRGRLWGPASTDDKLKLDPASSLAMVGKLGRFFLACTAQEKGPAKGFRAQVLSRTLGSGAWDGPVVLGPIGKPESPVVLVSGPAGTESSSDSLLAAWDGPRLKSPAAAWGSASRGTWTPALLPASTGGVGRIAAFLDERGRAGILWHGRPPELPVRVILGCFSDGPGAPWSAVGVVPTGGSKLDRTRPVAATAPGRVNLMWTEQDALIAPLVVGVSTDGGRSFTPTARLPELSGGDEFDLLDGAGNSVWAAWRTLKADQLVHAKSADRGRTWGRKPEWVGAALPETGQAALAALSPDAACLAWIDTQNRVQVRRLP